MFIDDAIVDDWAAMDETRVRQWINFACEKCEVSELSKKIHYQFSKQLTSSFGNARWIYKKEEGLIKLSTPLWIKAPDEERRVVTIHEACHVIANYVHGTNQQHNKNWKACMRKCGLPPDRCHELDTDEFKRKRKGSVDLVCKCSGRIHVFGSVRAKKWKRGVLYRCQICKTNLTEGPITSPLSEQKGE